MSDRSRAARFTAWVFDHTWVTVVVSVVVSGLLTVALSYVFSGQPAGRVGLSISTFAAAAITAVAASQRNRYVRALRATQAQLEARVVEVEALQSELRERATRDALTGVFNRRVLDDFAPGLLARSLRAHEPVTLALLDVDHFKVINDRHGHLVGDQVLVAIAAHLVAGLRASDVVCRFGGEEFAVLMPGIDADAAAERIDGVRRLFQGQPLDDRDPDGSVVVPLPSLSGGVAAVPRHAVDVDGLMRAADRALYRAKAEGRDRIVIARKGFDPEIAPGASDGASQRQRAVDSTSEGRHAQ